MNAIRASLLFALGTGLCGCPPGTRTCKKDIKLSDSPPTNGDNPGRGRNHQREKGTFDFHGGVASQPNEQFEGLELFNSNALEALDAAIVHQALYVTRQHK